MKLFNLTRDCWLAGQVREARGFWSRWRGWQGRRTPPQDEGLYLSPCRGVHTWGMRFALDAVYIDRSGRVLRIVTLAPGRVGPWLWRCRGVLELFAGTAAARGCREGDVLRAEGGAGW